MTLDDEFADMLISLSVKEIKCVITKNPYFCEMRKANKHFSVYSELIKNSYLVYSAVKTFIAKQN